MLDMHDWWFKVMGADWSHIARWLMLRCRLCWDFHLNGKHWKCIFLLCHPVETVNPSGRWWDLVKCYTFSCPQISWHVVRVDISPLAWFSISSNLHHSISYPGLQGFLLLWIQNNAIWLSVSLILDRWYSPNALFTTSPVCEFNVAANSSALGWVVPSGTSFDLLKMSWHENFLFFC